MIGAREPIVSYRSEGNGAQKEAQMSGETVLLRVVEGTQEAWRWMPFDEFLQQISIEAWNRQQALVGMVLPPGRPETGPAANSLT
jgi:hypothetical protein